MDAFVQLALIEKSKRVFATDANTFLGFPILSPIIYTRQTLEALATPNTNADYAAAADFARVMNFLPRDIVANMTGDRYLWDVYADVLARADVAVGGGGVTGSNSRTLLHDVAADGMQTDSAIYIAYRQYRDAWIVAREDYGAHKLSGEMTSDPMEKRRWTEVTEPALRAALLKAELDWKTLGQRDAIDAAIQAETSSAANDPLKRWSDWRAAFNPDIDLVTDPGGQYAPTGVSPRDFASVGAWPQFELSSEEMVQLVAQAPPELKEVLGDDSGGGIDRVSFEYRSVALVRPWFRPNAITSRVWRSTDPELLLSNGATPPTGACPAYVTAAVFIRNLKITPRTAVAVDPQSSDLRFTIRADQLTKRKLTVEAVPIAETAINIENAMAIAPSDAAATRAFRRVDMQSLNSAPTMVRPASVAIDRFELQMNPRVEISGPAPDAIQPTRSMVMRRSKKQNFGTSAIQAQKLNRFSDATLTRIDPSIVAMPIDDLPSTPAFTSELPVLAVPIENPSPTPASTGQPAVPINEAPPTSKPPADEIAILAFICKRLPKTPDANPDLNWL
jgi:hypothetical protein